MMPNNATSTTALSPSLLEAWATLGWRAMMTEVNLSPKPGLVDRLNCGAHKDMALDDFHVAHWQSRPGCHALSNTGLTVRKCCQKTF